MGAFVLMPTGSETVRAIRLITFASSQLRVPLALVRRGVWSRNSLWEIGYHWSTMQAPTRP